MWRTIADDLERDIRARVLNPGDKLPTETQLIKKYFVTRHMVRLALNRLSQRGLIVSSQGRGSFVRRPTLPFHLHRRTRFSEMVQQVQASHTYRTLRLEVGTMPPGIARELGLRLATPAVCLERLAIVNDQPTGLSAHYFAEARVPGFIEAYEKAGSITAALKSIGIEDYIRARTRIIARLPTAEEAELLELPRHVPLIITHAVNHDMNGVILEYGEARMAGDRVELVIEPEETLA